MLLIKLGLISNRGIIHGKQGNLLLAIESYTQAIELFPNATDKANAYFATVGIIYGIQGNFPLAIESFTQAIELYQSTYDKADAYYRRGITYGKHNNALLL